uniref:DUF7495 domain-containing protein n=1 Tax=Chromera velia CCMP2878 TaxID=1169474 RepID=A0A0G4GIV5_9ALVE|eukprot:Cvel_4751.t1-p1 / transcript=Cvel_4751.t1 / gene=Cvel_4751 / organism=Chromera_velia_CCMP2878 / gene_product=hypothetical protein / transcript_product=hypothetical protein / location=Cvel_scaffold212:9956-11546(-) / protein_length=457 / sequence_SO=supercontig / SO=protein_coding / is_pseudo=false
MWKVVSACLLALPTALGAQVPVRYRAAYDENWAGAASFCQSKGASLCSINDVCPGGAPTSLQPYPSNPFVSGEDQWAPVSDAVNEWIQIGVGGPYHPTCRLHIPHFGPPAWGVDGVPQAHSAFVLCCKDETTVAQQFRPVTFFNSWEGSSESYTDASSFCAQQGSSLCHSWEICPNGSPVSGLFFPQNGIDRWAPVADSSDEWVQVGDTSVGGGHPRCRVHNQNFPGTWWGLDSSPNPWSGDIYCCADPTTTSTTTTTTTTVPATTTTTTTTTPTTTTTTSTTSTTTTTTTSTTTTSTAPWTWQGIYAGDPACSDQYWDCVNWSTSNCPKSYCRETCQMCAPSPRPSGCTCDIDMPIPDRRKMPYFHWVTSCHATTSGSLDCALDSQDGRCYCSSNTGSSLVARARLPIPQEECNNSSWRRFMPYGQVFVNVAQSGANLWPVGADAIARVRNCVWED